MALMMMTAVGPKLPLQRNKSRISRGFDAQKLIVLIKFLKESALVRVDLTGEETQKAFDIVLTNLARTAPPIPGFRRMKGGLFVPKSFLLQMLGRDRENLKVKSQFKTIQTAEELEAAFTPGSEFGFNAVILPLTQEKEAVSEFASTRAAINTLRWFIWSYLPQYKAPPMSCMASAAVGSDGIAPFLVVVIAPQAFANLSSSLNFFSSCNKSQNPSPHASHYRYMNQSTVSHVVYLQSRLVFDDLPQQCADECVACSGRVDLFDGVGLDAAMEILDPRKPAKCVYLGVVLASLLPEGDEEELQTRAPESHGDFVFHRLRAGEELQLDVAHLDDVGLIPDAQDLLPGLRRRRPQRQPEVGVVGEQGSCFLCRPHGLQMSGSTWLRDQAYRSVVKDRGV
ncbi:Bacterial trigger factor protein (TF) [Musa troglodytarum]|uniref:Bacterial trigger factor protein (TF) n=1 Tax=Musa troglodytarum TaxID=320322 RepID=A0A9E7EHB3_9LILI|nr:Bacterial trigger factor protein (TF) [Musa troglodytarum]